LKQPTKRFLPYGRQQLEEDDIEAVAATLRGEWLTTGPAVREFEEAFARRMGARFAVSCTSGTAALHLAAAALGLGEGDTVVVPTMTFLATANAARFVGAEVEFADVDAGTGLMAAEHLKAALKRADGMVKAVMPVHLNGQCVDMAPLADFARQHGLAIVEDACHAVGSRAEGHEVGSCQYSDMTVFSLHPVKTFTAGEGGVITTNDEDYYRALMRLRNHSMVIEPESLQLKEYALDGSGERNPWYYEMQELGFNFRLSDINCALASTQLRKLDRFIRRRTELVAEYDRLLVPLAPQVRPVDRMADGEPCWHLYVARIDFEAIGMERAQLMYALRDRGIGSQVHYLPVHHQPYYRQRYGQRLLGGAEQYYDHALSLPLYPAMDNEDVAWVVENLAEVIGGEPQ